MAYKTKFLHFKTLASYNAERNKTQDGSEERKTFDAYLSFIDEGPVLCTWGKTYKCDINAEEVGALIESKNYITLEDVQNLTSIPVAIIDTINNTVSDELNAVKAASEGKPAMIYVKYEINEIQFYSLAELQMFTGSEYVLRYSELNLKTLGTLNYMLSVLISKDSVDILKIPIANHEVFRIQGGNGSYNVDYPEQVDCLNAFSTIVQACNYGWSFNLMIHYTMGNSQPKLFYPSSIFYKDTGNQSIEIATKAIPGIIEDDLLFILTKESITVTAIPSVYECTLTGEGDSLSGTIEGNAWGKKVKLIMPNGASTYVDLTEYSEASNAESRHAKKFASIIFSDDAAYDCSIEFLGTTESILVSVKKPLTVKGTMQATNFKEV